MLKVSTLSLLAYTVVSGFTMGASPVVAQVQDQVVTVYGDEKCPSSNGQEIVVCKHEPLTEKFRIPKDLRESEIAPSSLGGQTVSAVNSTGSTAVQINSCSTTGAGVSAGCTKKEIDAWKAQQKAEKEDQAGIP